MQEEFAAAVGITQPRVSALLADGILPRDGTFGQWLLAYCERLREQAAGRGQELTIERAMLARSQRIGQEIKNAVAQRTYAPVSLLEEVLAAAAANVGDRFDALPADLRKTCPDLDERARDRVASACASMRMQWVRDTSTLLQRMVDDIAAQSDDDEPGAAPEDDDQPEPAHQP